MSPLKLQDLKHSEILSHYFKIFCDCLPCSYLSFIFSQPGIDSSSSTLYCNLADKNKLQKLCSRGNLLSRKPLPLLHDSCTAVFFIIFETAVSSKSHLTITHLRGISCHSVTPRADSSVFLYVCVPTTYSPTAFCAPVLHFQGPESLSISIFM